MWNQATRSGHAKRSADGVDHGSHGAPSKASAGTDGKQHSSHTQFVPIDSLAKILSQLTHQEEHVHGITASVFERYLFPTYPDLGEKLFNYFRHTAEVAGSYLSASAFKHQAEKFLAVMNDQTILENYVKMYSDVTTTDGGVTPEALRSLLMSSYQLAMDSTGAGSCVYVHKIVNAVVVSCFHGKDTLSVSYVSHWIWQNCPRIVQGVHRYVVHVLTTAYRNGKALLSKEQPCLEISTPILERSDSLEYPQTLLPVSYVWLLSSTLPQCYLQTSDTPKNVTQAFVARGTGGVCPRHWTVLYNSSEHGTGANRFLHHVLGYRGPTLLFIKADSSDKETERPVYCICSAVEWRESHLFWGDEDSMAIELFPSYKIVEKGAKVLYLNTNIRGYPHGLRFGSNPRVPYINVDESFQSVSIAGAPYRISSLEVWGCGDPKLRERQLDIKKWQVKEAEKQRIVKLSASDWLDHPDRYLLELAGRASYNESNK